MKDLLILIFYENGKKSGEIYKPYIEKIKVDDNFKWEFLNTILQDPRVKGKRIVEEVRRTTHFPKFFPPLHSFYIDEHGDIFIKTFQEIKGKVLFYKYGSNGKYLCSYKLTDYHIDIADAKNFTAFSLGHYYLYIDEEGNYILHKEKLNSF